MSSSAKKAVGRGPSTDSERELLNPQRHEEVQLLNQQRHEEVQLLNQQRHEEVLIQHQGLYEVTASLLRFMQRVQNRNS
ncbi:hypothetical protein F2P81_005979 [Scophthalmus maximus]|uniref:Uncharacterized protein n=1 Tax=Scophthalmus maximus TaxID=52904 RepID=A0A6A4T804_SCOMX|nr:hypothetical protein F2P81_005979 [Scophthalmus maximus]